MRSALGAWSLSHWTTREVPPIIIDDANFVPMPQTKNHIPLQPVNQLPRDHSGNKSCYFP